MDDKAYTRLLNYAFRLLSRRDYSEHEMRKKIELRVLSGTRVQKRDLSAVAPQERRRIEKVLAKLKEFKYLDDEKFARQFISSRLEFSPKGKFMLRYELKQKGIPLETFSKIWEEIGVADSILADRILAQKKRSLARLVAEKRKKKIMSLLASRGISPEVIYDKINA